MNDLVVTIRCTVYNHEPYIRQCLEGFVMQKTNFRFEAIVHDDASTDNSAAIIREYAEKYPDIIKPILQTENQYSKRDGSIRRIMDAHTHGKYVAICEGDDYWIDPFKLQKQVDFLEENPEYGMVRTEIHRYYQEKKEFEYNFFSTIRKDIHEDSLREYLLKGWFAAPCTWLLRRELYSTVPVLPKDCFSGDINVILCIASSSKIGFIKDATAVYRILPISASHFSNLKDYLKFALKVKNTRKFYARKQSSLKFRLMFWWSVCVKSMRPSLRNCKILYPSWFIGIVVDFFDCLIFDKN